MGGSAVRFEEWPRVFSGVDILIGSTAAPHHVLTRPQLEPLLGARRQRQLFCIDLAVPRDIDPEVNLLDGVYLYDIDSLQAIAQQSMEVRRGELQVCETMIERHVGEFLQWLRSNPVMARDASTRLRGGTGDLPAHGV
jgi:glutamyl-tRNA reductase